MLTFASVNSSRSSVATTWPGQLKIERQTTLVNGRPITTTTKTGKGRTVAIPPSIAAELEAHLASTTGFGRSPMFIRSDGEPITNNALTQAWRRAARKVGLGQFHPPCEARGAHDGGAVRGDDA